MAGCPFLATRDTSEGVVMSASGAPSSYQNRQDYRIDRIVVCRLGQPRCVPKNDNFWEQHRENPCSPWYVNPVNPVILSSRLARHQAGAGIINN